MRNAYAAFLLIATALSSAAPARAQYSPAGGGDSFKWLDVPCTASPVFDLSKATAFTITLCATPAVASFAGISKANGRPISIVICQDSAGGRSFAYPGAIYGAALISAAPNMCTGQVFAVVANQLFATSAGSTQSNQPVPSLLQAPYSSMALFPADAVMAVANEPTGLVLTASSDWGSGQLWNVHGFGQVNSTSEGHFKTITISFWVEDPDKTGLNRFGLGQKDPVGGDICAYEISTGGVNRIGFYAEGSFENVVGQTANQTSYYDASNRQIFLKYRQDISGAIVGGTGGRRTYCSYSLDNGATWGDLGTRITMASQAGDFQNLRWQMGGTWQKHTGAKMHITSVSIAIEP